ncbi:hypothetical protein KJ596_01910 [Patescibacteria group bacterium]|nr:hypothetical protein [Patescibacteria group bacterium]MBU1868010.1 hypothetical protein [Patescibacteria group bacterium]
MGPDVCIDNSEKYVYNNVWYAMNSMPILNGSSPAHYAGNIVWEVGGEIESQHGERLDPGFNPSVIDDTSFDINTIWERYRPANAQVNTPGVSYEGLNWPGTTGVDYRGAVPPNGGSPAPTATPTSIPSVPGDLNGDGDVDIFDLVIVGSSFGRSPGSSGYDPRADANQSGGAIDIFDLIIVGSNFGE